MAGSNKVRVVKCRSPHLAYLNAALVVLLVAAGGASAAPARTSQPGQAASCSKQLRHCPRARDKQALSAPRRLSASAVDISRIRLSWRASTDKIGVAGYRVFRDGVRIGTTSATSYTASRLSCGRSYSFSVAAYDAAGNTSPKARLRAATSACPPPAASFNPAKWRFAYSNRLVQDQMARYGYNLIDVSTKDEADAVPAGMLAQVWLYDYDNTTCSWEKDDTYVRKMVASVANDPRVAGFYFSNEPDPFACPNAPRQHEERNALIHSLAPTKYTLIGIDANWRDHFNKYGSMWVGTADYINYNPYICYVSDTKSCDYAWLDRVISVAQSLRQPYFIALQAFAEGDEWRWPTPREEAQMLNRLKNPALTGLRGYLTFSWNWQNDPLSSHPGVLAEIQAYNLGRRSPCCG